MKKRKKNTREYVVGYEGEREVVYGPDEKVLSGIRRPMFCDRMTLWSARRQIRTLATPGARAQIYRLVPVETVIVGEPNKKAKVSK